MERDALEPDLQGLLVDWGGVLTTDIFTSFRAFCRNEGIEPTLVRDLFRHDPEGRRALFDLETGALTEPELEQRFGELLGLREDRISGLVDRLFGGMRADVAMFDAVRLAKAAGRRTGLLSNSWGVDRYDRTHFPQLFDAVVISGEEGIRKPDRAIYELAIERMELRNTRTFAHTEFNAAVTQKIKRADALRHPSRVIRGELHDAMAKANVLGPLRRRAEEDFRGR